jgi:4-hydroxyphenylpyruvate dioxygenase
MRLSIATVSISGDLAEKLQAIAGAGFDGVEIFENDLLTFGGSPSEAGGMARDLGLEITLYQPFRDFEGLPEPHRSRAFDRARRKFDVMQALGADLMLICSNVSPLALGGIDRICGSLARSPASGDCGLATRPSPGGAMSTTTVMPGKSFDGPIIRMSG